MFFKGLILKLIITTEPLIIDKLSEAFDAALNKAESGALKVLITY